MGCVELSLLNPDQTDFAPRPLRPSNWDKLCLVFAIVFHIFDLYTDVQVAVYYFMQDEFYFGLVTVLIVFLPSIVTSCVSYRMYTLDKDEEIAYKWERKKCLRIIMLFLQLAPVLRYIDSLRYACKSRKAAKRNDIEEQERYYRLMLKEDADVALLRVFESFLEAAPQQVLQISFVLKHGATIQPIVSVASSLFGMALCLLTYQRNIRYVQEDKDNISFWGSVFIFLWHLLVSISRIFMLGAMVYIAWSITLFSMCIHWIVMTISLSFLESHDFCSSTNSISFQRSKVHEKIANFLFSAVLGLVYIFTYITPGEGGTCCRYASFYVICLLENLCGAVVWHVYGSKFWLSDALTFVCIVPFCLGCIFMMIYHWKFHPKHYNTPSIFTRESSQKKESELPQIPETPSPKLHDSANAQNGFVPSETGDGDASPSPIKDDSCLEKL